MTRPWMRVGMFAVLLSLAACREQPPQVLGTLEWDRITLPAPPLPRDLRVHGKVLPVPRNQKGYDIP